MIHLKIVYVQQSFVCCNTRLFHPVDRNSEGLFLLVPLPASFRQPIFYIDELIFC